MPKLNRIMRLGSCPGQIETDDSGVLVRIDFGDVRITGSPGEVIDLGERLIAAVRAGVRPFADLEDFNGGVVGEFPQLPKKLYGE